MVPPAGGDPNDDPWPPNNEPPPPPNAVVVAWAGCGDPKIDCVCVVAGAPVFAGGSPNGDAMLAFAGGVDPKPMPLKENPEGAAEGAEAVVAGAAAAAWPNTD